MDTGDGAPAMDEPLRIEGISRGSGDASGQHRAAADVEAIDAGSDAEFAAGEVSKGAGSESAPAADGAGTTAPNSRAHSRRV